MTRFSRIAGNTIWCGPILNWFEVNYFLKKYCTYLSVVFQLKLGNIELLETNNGLIIRGNLSLTRSTTKEIILC